MRSNSFLGVYFILIRRLISFSVFYQSLNIRQMTQLSLKNIHQRFKSRSINQKDYLKYDELYLVISKLNEQSFDEETYQQIWDQCKLNSKGEARVSDFNEYLLKAEELLIQKKNQIKNELKRVQVYHKNQPNDFTNQKRFKDQCDRLSLEQQAIQNSLSIIRKPFIIKNNPQTKYGQQTLQPSKTLRYQAEEEERDIVHQIFDYDSSQTANYLSFILTITLLFTSISILSSFYVNQFINLFTCSVILAQFFLQTISKKIIKFNLLLLLSTTVLEVIWIALYSGNLWYLPQQYEFTIEILSYLKFTVISRISCICLRFILMYLYLSQFHIDQYQTYFIKFMDKEINLQKQVEPYDTNKHPFQSLLHPYFNKVQAEDSELPRIIN